MWAGKNSGYCQTRYGNVWVFTTYGNSELSLMKRNFGRSELCACLQIIILFDSFYCHLILQNFL